MSEHPFAQYVRTLGRGRHGARPLDVTQAQTAMRMILNDEATPEQVGAFLMLMRVREETPAETAGMVLALRETLSPATTSVEIDLDWPSYSGKRRHLPWFVLSARLLAQNGIRIFMHGSADGPADRVFAEDALNAVGLTVARNHSEAMRAIEEHNFAFIALENLHPVAAKLFGLRNVLGLRSPINTVVRMVNPGHASFSLQSVFHPGYAAIHSQAGVLLSDNLCVFKGEGGEVERNPDTACAAHTVRGDTATIDEWPALFPQRHVKDEQLELGRLREVWRGTGTDEYGLAAVIGTTAIALRLMQRANDPAAAMAQAQAMWDTRNTNA